MKTISKTLTTVALSAIAIFTANTDSSAQTLSALDSGAVTLNVNSVPTTSQGPSNTGSTATDGSYFFDTAQVYPGTFTGDLSSLPTFVSSVTGSGAYFASSFDSQLTVGADSYYTGYSYNFNDATAPITLAKITLSSTVSSPSSFNIGLLSDNASAPTDTTYSLAIFNSSNVQIGSTLAINSTVTGDTAQNNFYYANVQNAGEGDYLLVYGAGGSTTGNLAREVTLGGVTFDAVTTPEPSTLALVFAGVGLLLFVARRKAFGPRL